MKKIIFKIFNFKKNGFIDNFTYIIKVGKLKKHFFYSMLIAVISAFFETTTIYAISPFMSIINRYNDLYKEFPYSFIYEKMNFTDPKQLVFFFGYFLVSFLLISNTISYIKEYVMQYSLISATLNLSQILFRGYLKRNYSFFLTRHSADFIRNINNYTKEVAEKITYAFSKLLSSFLSIILILSTILFLNPVLSLFLIFSILSLYLLVMKGSKQVIKSASKQKVAVQKERDKFVIESLSSIKDVKALGIEDYFYKNYNKSSSSIKQNHKTVSSISLAPRKIIEVVLFSIIIAFVLFSFKSGQFNDVLPSISLYMFACYRILPHVGTIYDMIVKIKYGSDVLQVVVDEFKVIKKSKEETKDYKNLNFDKYLELKNISFSYPNSEIDTIDNISLKIDKNQIIGIIGKTGCGKTTLIDILMGLIFPKKGTLKLDDVTIDSTNLKSYKKMVGYVPQFISLSSASIAENIAFGIEKDKIDYDRIKDISKKVDLDGLIELMPNKYDELLGERGVRLSGGQRQRIGIARALYINPKILIFDEATSSLDNETETFIINSIEKISKDLTIIMIAHRLTTLKSCNVIYKLENGKIVDSGNPEKFLNNYILEEENQQ